MAVEALFRHGEPLMVDHTPTVAVPAGTVVVVGVYPRICHRRIEANVLGALAASGGVYRGTAGAAIAVGVKVYWDDTAKKVVIAGSGNKHLGSAMTATAADGDSIDFTHQPNGIAL